MGFFQKLFGGGSDTPKQNVPAAAPAPAATALEQVKGSWQKKGITSLTAPLPYYALTDIKVAHSNTKLFVDFPQASKAVIKRFAPTLTFNPDTSFDGFGYYSDIPMRSGIIDLVELMNAHRQKVANAWIAAAESGQAPANELRLGALHYNPFPAAGSQTGNSLQVQIYETDDFTNDVFRSIYAELRLKGHEMMQATIDEVNRYNCFLNRLTLTALLIAPSAQGDQFVIAGTDVPLAIDLLGSDQKHFDLTRWFAQAASLTDGWTPSAIRFYDLFLNTAAYTTGITATVRLNQPLSDQAVAQIGAKGGHVVSLSGTAVADLLAQGTLDPVTAYAVEMIKARPA
ncbi:hypothetical protein [Heliophilum fasciatum]|uniref:Uncharacterized protein n=1 Tax=Heliophilum fasciatum TaxID=35700 RepID=A0A4R2RXI2_9FIRM|nr:hypothetical protein [Heliophilum fasciatum]MCW2277177.1 hypothetical protein [Heliophilum fasciatum]TCP68188.1 hypothetical protein EDD73_10491 [Heliophilum fasciatum]